MVSTSKLGDMFRSGATKGVASRTSIIDGQNNTFLVDYGWAVIGKRDKKSGKLTYYKGWYGYSPTTSKHISQTGIRDNADRVVDDAPRTSDMVRLDSMQKANAKKKAKNIA